MSSSLVNLRLEYGFIISVLNGKASTPMRKYGVFLSSQGSVSGSGKPRLFSSSIVLRSVLLNRWASDALPLAPLGTNLLIVFLPTRNEYIKSEYEAPVAR
ncbi:hypothetical protein DPMN_123846 [Dreissena polymorpha]|uniref:Uncharacterized protein n=1 Tax=Dreissena polymorpha TaxID=45954 RepID=A0A9D4GR49_DREPO|nr:hypothetical protein DPMN_123846 [Dreissena polymorpha]